ncbi:MAG: DUF547 domain-containing protein [Pseudomonadota bacterium]
MSLVLLTFSSMTRANSAERYQLAMESWSSVLAEHVDELGRVDFEAIAADPEQLENVIVVIESYGPASHPEDFQDPEKVMAYHINTYNALAMYGVIDRGIPDGFTSFFKRASFFRFRDVVIAGETTNLYDYENKVIRPLDEPRSHFALNCMVKDCPRLPQTPFTAENLDEELEAVSFEFFSKPLHLRVDDDKETIYVSSILKFYTEDFVESGRARDLPQYINQFLEEPLPADYKVKYIDYDWRINSQPEAS